MLRYFPILVLALAVALNGAPEALAQSAGDKANAKAEADREQKAKAQRKKDKQFNRDIQYRHVVGPDVLPLGPFTVSFYVNGQLTEHRIRVALQAVDTATKSQLENFKPQLFGIVYPLCLRLFENGRPTQTDLLTFKTDVEQQISTRFKDSLKGVFIESVL